MTTSITKRIFVQSNSTDHNEVVAYRRTAKGTLLPAGQFRTGGFGTGIAIGPFPEAVNSQGSLAATADGRYLFAVNAGSNDISAFALTDQGPRLVSKVSSGGAEPVSIATHGSLVYVVNKFGAGGIVGFTVDSSGQLAPLSGSAKPLSGQGTGPAQLSFTPDGGFLVLTEMLLDRIVTYRINAQGRPGEPQVHTSSGQTPFGFAFDPEGRLVVSEAFQDAPNGSAASSYRLSATAVPAVISASIPTHQTSACWSVITPNGQYAYVSNSLSGTITGYRIQPPGNLVALNSNGLTADTGEDSFPIDMATSADGKQLFVLNGGTLSIGVFDVQLGGGLTPRPYVGGIPAGAIGLVAV